MSALQILVAVPTASDVLDVNKEPQYIRDLYGSGPNARQLLIAGSTAGVLDGTGKTIPEIDGNTITRLIKQGNASAGMVAKLQACRSALQNGVAAVSIVNGRSSPEKLFKRKADTTIIT